ncbi:MAG: BNR-containing glycosyl hydrolase [Betaproteobacteria bacterium]|nr:BNR-containing glycosyl hydrolase [Betaproteobacteria bacterium]
MLGNGKTRIFAGAGYSVSRAGVQLRGGLFRRSPGDTDWQTLTAGLPDKVEVRAIAVHPQNPEVIYVGTQDGPYRSTDAGNHWERLGFPDRDAVVWSLTIHPTRPHIMYAGTSPVALYRSENSGDTWHKLHQAKSPAHCEKAGFDTRTVRITVDPSRPDDIYAALEVSGVIRSADAGETWTDMSASLIKLAGEPHLKSSVGGRSCGDCEGMLDSHAIAVSGAAPGTAFLAIRMGLFRSDDRGASWYDTQIGRFSPLTYCRDVIVSPHDERVMYACLSPAAFSNDGSLYRSDDMAQTWRRIDHGVKADSTLMAVAAHPSERARVYCISRGGQVFGTEDSGASWQEYRLPEGVQDAYTVACA